jgi:hypothetical protein
MQHQRLLTVLMQHPDAQAPLTDAVRREVTRSLCNLDSSSSSSSSGGGGGSSSGDDATPWADARSRRQARTLTPPWLTGQPAPPLGELSTAASWEAEGSKRPASQWLCMEGSKPAQCPAAPGTVAAAQRQPLCQSPGASSSGWSCSGSEEDGALFPGVTLGASATQMPLAAGA